MKKHPGQISIEFPPHEPKDFGRMNDYEIVCFIRQGVQVQDGQGELLKRYENLIAAIAMRSRSQLQGREEIEDAKQVLRIHFVRKCVKFRPVWKTGYTKETRFEGWITQVLQRRFLDYLRDSGKSIKCNTEVVLDEDLDDEGLWDKPADRHSSAMEFFQSLLPHEVSLLEFVNQSKRSKRSLKLNHIQEAVLGDILERGDYWFKN